jgi:hypothetical protein
MTFVSMTIAPYQYNLTGQLVPVPLELQFNQFFLFPLGFRAVDERDEELARVRYLPWQDGGIVRVAGKLPIEGVLVFGGKEAISQAVIRFEGEQFSGVIPLSRQGFIEMAERKAKQSQRRAWSLRLGQMAIVTAAAETILECDSNTQMHVTNTAAVCI